MKKFLLFAFSLITYTSFAYQLTDIVICDDDDDGLVCVDLTSKIPEILSGLNPSDAIITFHETFDDSDAGINAISNVANFCTTSSISTVYVRLENIVNATTSLSNFNIFGIVTRAETPTPLEACDTLGNGIASFDLNSKIDEITNGPYANRLVTFHLTEMDAQNGLAAIVPPFTNTLPYSQTIYARAATTGNLVQNDCYEIASMELIVTSNACDPVNGGVYEVSTIPHIIYDINATPTSNLDDYFTPIVTMPFDFNFFNQTYDEFTIGTNGIVVFDTVNATTNCRWNLEAGQQVPSAELYVNSIFGPYHDLDNTGDGVLGYGIIGEAPFRKMVVFFDNMNQFSAPCVDPTTTQIILYETFNIIDVQIEQKLACTTWNGGLAVLGIQNQDASIGYSPVGRNMGVWDAINEGHRFRPTDEYENIFSVLCDTNLDGYVEFNLQNINVDLLDGQTGTVSYFVSEDDVLNNMNALPELYTNTSNTQKIYARILNSTTNEVTIKTVTLAGISCTQDYDADGVSTMDEDVNQDGNLGNDDTDGDGIPDFIDEDDDGDYVLTNLELINTATGLPENGFLDTDGDMIPNHRDADDDGDGTLTVDEDYNGNNNPEDDDTNNNGIPDYLDNLVFLSVGEFSETNIRIYPNPVKEKLTIETKTNVQVQNIEIYSVEGRLIHAEKFGLQNDTLTIDVSNFASGFYVLRIKSIENTVITKQFIVE